MNRQAANSFEQRERILANDCFHLEIEGISTAGFLSCSGLGGRVEVFEYLEGGMDTPSRFAGARSYTNLVLRRGLTTGNELYEWFLRGDRRSGAVVLVSRHGEEKKRWEFTAAWPCAWQGPRLDAAVTRVAIEFIEIVHEGLRCRPS